MKILQRISKLLPEIKARKPLIHHITNFVTVNDCANITLAIGASPIMAVDGAEVAEIVSMASALVLNSGTLTSDSIKSMLIAGKKANELKIPVILDPVGVGATTLRNEAIRKLLTNVKIAVLKGNMSEIKFISGLDVSIRGVDSTASEEGSAEAAKKLAAQLGCVVAITGKRDIISDGDITFFIDNGHEMLAHITGTGCMISSLIASYSGVTDDYLTATLGGIISMGIAGEIASRALTNDQGIGSFKVNLFDCTYKLTSDTIIKEGAISVYERKD